MRTITPAMALNLMGRALKRHRVFLIAAGALLAGFQILVCAVASSAEVEDALREFSRSLPPIFQSLAGDEFALGMTSRGLLTFAWNHPAVHATLAAAMILLASRAIAGEIEWGTIELLLSHPISRPAYLLTQIGFALTVLAALAGMILIGDYVGLSVFDLNRVLRWREFLPVAANLVSLEVAIYGVTLLFSSVLKEGGRVVMLALLFVLISFLLQFVARLWSPIHFLRAYTIFEYYSPQRIISASAAPWRDVTILLMLGFAGAGFGFFRFIRRDIP